MTKEGLIRLAYIWGGTALGTVERIIAALATARVELLPEGGSYGAGVRWTAPRDRWESR